MKTNIIKFQNNDLITIIDEDGNIRVAIKPIADAIGLNSESVCRAIKNHEILGAEHTIQSVQVGENQKREYLTLPIQFLNGWLFSIELRKVKQEAKSNLIKYQKECYKALFEYFYGKNKQLNDYEIQKIELKKQLNQLDIDIIKLQTSKKELKQRINNLENNIFEVLQLSLFN